MGATQMVEMLVAVMQAAAVLAILALALAIPANQYRRLLRPLSHLPRIALSLLLVAFHSLVSAVLWVLLRLMLIACSWNKSKRWRRWVTGKPPLK